ncbi:PQQ-binding-like beta-propeller repeat protein [Emticicia sp. BO119]|uniref:outer membrane protein assembly factor BamB family protein n=1 Tax=Emticicia sp. BO119 TaxID=2757768 RepID=UPI0015F01649|nr:PQQ-binding-like beta-propeller repeat protein [Emticicia sp. BO119]MBA4852304.1 PQQ-binding-like beta-propeller repeat protein [Emticicia sp. BO119]
MKGFKKKFYTFRGLFFTFLLSGILSQITLKAQLPDDSPAAREVAIARLRNTSPCVVCDDGSKMSSPYGTSCNSRAFRALPILAAPQKQWEINPGWWGVWPPFIVGNLILTGSCNNDGNAGLSAIDKNTGKTVWRIDNICNTGNRKGSMGYVNFFELASGEVLLIYPREDGLPTDHYVIDVKSGRIVRTLTPAKRGTIRGRGGVFTVLNQNTSEGNSYISALSTDMSNILWQNKDFRLAMPDKLNPFYTPTFSAPAISGGILFQTARSKEQKDPPTRQLHAIDLKTGKTLWRHIDQPDMARRGNTVYRSDDGIPIVADGKVIIRIRAENNGLQYTSALRALDINTGRILWTTKTSASNPVTEIFNRVVACNILVTEIKNGKEHSLVGFNLADGSVEWSRHIDQKAQLMASSGGVFYVGERILNNDNTWKENKFQGFDGKTGTLLWTTNIPEYYLGLGTNNQWDIENPNAITPSWTIDSDGAIYGVTLKGVFKLK